MIMKYRLYYGIINKHIDVTNICSEKCIYNDVLYITNDQYQRDQLFTDPAVGHDKFIFIHVENDMYVYNNRRHVYMDMDMDMKQDKYIAYDDTNVPYAVRRRIPLGCLEWIHSKLDISHGTFMEEDVEQKLAVTYIHGHEKVLEIGGNIGRVAMVVSYILNMHENTNFVSMECNTDIAKQLIENRDNNNLKFHVETSALSQRSLIHYGWSNVESDTLLPPLNGIPYMPVTNISMDALKSKYGIEFDTLIVDCEEAFYTILQDFPDILSNIRLIIMENDYLEKYKKEYVDKILCEAGFEVVYSEKGGWPRDLNRFPCYDNFYEVWKCK